jgi:hypothetical protein
MAAEQFTRNLVGRMVVEVECDLILETFKHCPGSRTHAAQDSRHFHPHPAR